MMLAIADNANDLGVAFPGYEYLAWKCRMVRRSIIRLASTCAESGELWMMHRNRQRSNVYIVTIGLSLGELEQAAIQASKIGALPPTGSDILTPPPQVLVVVNRNYEVPECHQVVIPGSPIGDTAMSPEPPLPVINHQRTVIEPPATPAVDGDVLEKLQQIGVNGKKASELILSYTENDELGLLVPRLSQWIIHLDKQANVTSPIGLAITKTAECMDPPNLKDDYWQEFAKRQNKRRTKEKYTSGPYGVCPKCSMRPCHCEEFAEIKEG